MIEAIFGVVGILIGTVITAIITLYINNKKTRENRDKEKLKTKAERPSLYIKEFTHGKDFNSISRTRFEYLIKLSHNRNSKNEITVIDDSIYNNEKDLVFYEYTLSNLGKERVISFDIYVNSAFAALINLDRTLGKLSDVNKLISNSKVIYNTYSLKQDEDVAVRFWVHEAVEYEPCKYPLIMIFLKDSNGNYWSQSLFTPNNHIEESIYICNNENDYFRKTNTYINRTMDIFI